MEMEKKENRHWMRRMKMRIVCNRVGIFLRGFGSLILGIVSVFCSIVAIVLLIVF